MSTTHRIDSSIATTLTIGLLIACVAPAIAEPLVPTEFTPAVLASQVFGRPANAGRTGIMHFSLENRRGHKRKRTARIFHSDAADETRVAIYFTAPGAIEETAFLSLDRQVEANDENWLYLPATERVRRLPASQRSDYFMGTDLTYGDIKDNFKFAPKDWQFTACDKTPWPDSDLPCLGGSASTLEVAAELGYSRFVATIDTDTWFPQRVRYFDLQGEPLKDIVIERQEEIGAAWTAMAFVLTNLQSNHSTRVHFTEMEQRAALSASVFDANALEFGVPDLSEVDATHE